MPPSRGRANVQNRGLSHIAHLRGKQIRMPMPRGFVVCRTSKGETPGKLILVTFIVHVQSISYGIKGSFKHLWLCGVFLIMAFTPNAVH